MRTWTAAAALAAAVAAPAGQLITSLPGLDMQPSFNQYSGYLTVNAAGTHHNFYWLVEAQNNPSTAPLVVWFTGGPGCSGLYALLTEHGPFVVDQTNFSHLLPNPYSWNMVANMLYIEQPTGVGFSYATDGNYTSGDDDAAAKSYEMMNSLLEAYPEYVNRPVYLAGESYGGHYVPQLASLLYSTPISGFNFQGFMVGNPSFCPQDGESYWGHMCSHGLCSSSTFAAALQACNGTFIAPNPSPLCAQLLSTMRQQFVYINPYNIEGPCNGPPSVDGSCFTQHAALAAADPSKPGPMTSISQTVVPCMNVSGAVAYLNQRNVQDALHVIPGTAAGLWDVCSSYLNYTQYASTVVPIYQALHGKVDILVYSGDVDSCVPQPGTQACVDSLGFTRHGSDWDRWFITDVTGAQQVAGYARVYDAPSTGSVRLFAYVTVRDAGHMVPTFKPVEALALFEKYLNKDF